MPTLFMLDCRRADSQVALQRARTLVMIPHEKHLYLRHYHATGGWPCCAAPQGRYRAMLVPSVDVLSIDACPPSARAKSDTMASPSPFPPARALKRGSKALAATASDMP
jgi:hypothetical protein